ncbi:PucR family transcriptional regulator [Kutzneria sp. CA-103260]|uniref:PucR family transcriptional regulator n=1 Tax=Kutzneria sp. CA-103260 TaxID=2802641 RepID=UPI001BA87AE5|nr:helix-turn-helix domain-containing protein [Kutzneria sp. CA-103260]
MSARLPELAASMVHHYEREVPRLVRDDEQMVGLLAASVLENVQTAVHLFQHNMDPANVEAPAAALEYARRLAQRGTPVVDLVRAYNLGQTLMLDHALGEGIKHIDDAALLGTMIRHVMTVSATLIDRVIQQAVTAYEEERNHWQLNRSAMRAVKVRALLDDTQTSTREAEAALGYELSGTHLGLVGWCRDRDSPVGRDVLDQLGPVVDRLADRLRCASEPLMVAHDENTVWVWLPIEHDGPIEPDVFETATAGGGVRIAVGEPGVGLDGFRRTHQQALRIHALALVANGSDDAVLRFRTIGPIALMADDLPAARVWVGQTLGRLAVDDESHGRLRETLLAFLTAGSSYTAAAAALTLHKNSVQYRVRRAEELLGHPVTENRFNVETALSLCRWLGPAVLTVG